MSEFRIPYYDRQGNPLTMDQWVALFDSQEQREAYRRVGSTQVGKAWISTVWIGLDMGFSRKGPPIIFETMIFGGPMNDETWRYATEAEAEAGHALIVAMVRRRHHGLTKHERDERRRNMKIALRGSGTV